ncbi:hypothetical protein [Mycobacterium asiaticum]|uniref:Uncharacterized protein n=1 Tax=Mycobacterium asiaticum TaxID=1790 RepID=A0A1A3L0Y1_MYCAS|nr:hypothetical protein [Mycobacterium asiaticum]OBJ90339.1 hypothetical protein A5640_03005 [Mycobacterium asiaticum]
MSTDSDLDKFELDDYQHLFARTIDTRNHLFTELAAGIDALERASGTLEQLRTAPVEDVEFSHGRDGRDVAAFLDDAIRYARAAYAVVHTVIDQKTR